MTCFTMEGGLEGGFVLSSRNVKCFGCYSMGRFRDSLAKLFCLPASKNIILRRLIPKLLVLHLCCQRGEKKNARRECYQLA